MKKFFVSFMVALVFSFAAAHAAEVNSFTWDIKNIDAYNSQNLLFAAIDKKYNGVIEMRDEIYSFANTGGYIEAATHCKLVEATQKIIFGADYFDEGLAELIAKLYLSAGEYAEAEREINLLSDNAHDNLTKIRVLNLKSDLCNRTGKYGEALQVTQAVQNLLQSTPDETLSLINQARVAAALCGLNENQKSLAIAEKIFPSMQNAFGKLDIETFSLMSTLIEDYRKLNCHKERENILGLKEQIILAESKNPNLAIVAKFLSEQIDFDFDKGENDRAEFLLNDGLLGAAKLVENSYYISLQFYKTLNETALRHLKPDHPIVLKSELGLADVHNIVGDIPQSIEICTKSLPKFKKAFGEQGNETLTLLKILSDDYILLGKYSDAKKIIDERLTVCKKNFGDHDAHTVESAVDLANIYYKTGKYKTADKMLEDIEAGNRDLLEANPATYHELLLIKESIAFATGAYKKAGDIISKDLPIREKLPNRYMIKTYCEYIQQQILATRIISNPDNFTDVELALLNSFKFISRDYQPRIMATTNEMVKTYIVSNRLKDAQRIAKQIYNLSRAHFGENNFYEWTALNNLSKIRRAEGNFSDALAIDTQALKIAEKVCGKNSLERMQSLDSIASDHAATGNFSEAIKIREQTLAEYKKILEDDDETTISMMTNLAENYVAVKKYSDAVKLCDETLVKQKNPVFMGDEISPDKNVVELFRIKTTAQKLSGKNVDAAENYRKMIKAYESGRLLLKDEFFSTIENKSRWFADKIPVYRDAAAVFASREIDDRNFAFYCAEFCKGRNLIDRYNDALVMKDYLLTPDEKNSLAAYQNLLQSCEMASEYAVTQGDEVFFSSLERIYGILRLDYHKFKGELRKKYSGGSQADSAEETDSWIKDFDVNKNRQAIPDGACFVEFMKISDEELLTVFLRNDSDVGAANISVDKNFFDRCRLYHELNSYADINALHGDGKYLWRTGDSKYIIAAGRTAPVAGAVAINDSAKWSELKTELSAELSQKLIPTIETHAGGCAHWIISPDAELNLLPFETLNYRGKMLIESVDVSYVPSLAVLNLMKKRERKNHYLGQSKEFFAMGDAVYGNSDVATSRGSQLDFFNTLRSKSEDKVDITALKWSNLPGTARELDKISPLFESKDIFRREQVTEKNLRSLNLSGELSKYKYLLFATHGLFVPEMPEVSSIVLSQEFNDADTDGYITVGEWMGYDLRSNLVYLSACESGLGGYQAGEGIVGIPYALTVAGNKDTVMSLWKVDDEATAEFTSAVFEKLSKGKSEVAALNETKREFLQSTNPKHRDSSVWAAFILYGI